MADDVTLTSVAPYLRYPDGDAAVAWLTRVFGFGPSRSVSDDTGALTEGEIAVGSVRIDISGGQPPEASGSPGAGGSGALLIVGVDDVDAQYRRIRAAGVDVEPPCDEPYGPRTCHVTDPWRYRWYFWQGDAGYPEA